VTEPTGTRGSHLYVSSAVERECSLIRMAALHGLNGAPGNSGSPEVVAYTVEPEDMGAAGTVYNLRVYGEGSQTWLHGTYTDTAALHRFAAERFPYANFVREWCPGCRDDHARNVFGHPGHCIGCGCGCCAGGYCVHADDEGTPHV
jgi:hypothetical protein